MLHNSGPYGPNETPVNMGTAVNIPSMNTPLNIGHNLNNIAKMPQQLSHTPSGHYNLPDYNAYSHSQLSTNPQIPSFPAYNSLGYQSAYLSQNPHLVHNTSWQSAPPTNSHSDYPHNVLNYPIPVEKRTANEALVLDNKELIHPESTPINIPQMQSKTFQRQGNESHYGLYNENHDKPNYYDQYHEFNHKSTESPLLDVNRRKSLENTVRLIENILINSSKKGNEVENVTNESQNEKQEKIAQSKAKELIENVAKSNEHNTIDLKVTKINNSTQKFEQDCKQDNVMDPLDSATDEIEDQKDENMINKNEQVKLEKESSDTDTEITDNDISRTGIVVKVEPLCWNDLDDNPFLKDVHGVSMNDVSYNEIVDCKISVEEAGFDAKNAPQSTLKFYECPHCNILINNPKRFLIHTKWHSFGLTNNKRIEMAKERELSKKERREAKVIERLTAKEVVDETGKKMFACKECDKLFNTRGSLKNHRQRHHPRRIKQCPLCPATLLGWMALRAHTVSAHPARLSCTLCGKHFKYQHSLVKHQEMHATEEQGLQMFPCDECNKKFKYQHSLARHKDTHLEKTVVCDECPKKFGSIQQLKIHQRVHQRSAKPPTHRCAYCAKAFYEAYNLAVHERTHRNERPYTCDICHTNYGTNSSLKRHKRVSHSAAKPYECVTCHRSFSSSSIRDRHAIRTHAGPAATPYACQLCQCRYTKQKDLQKHMNKIHPKSKKKIKSDSE